MQSREPGLSGLNISIRGLGTQRAHHGSRALAIGRSPGGEHEFC